MIKRTNFRPEDVKNMVKMPQTVLQAAQKDNEIARMVTFDCTNGFQKR